MPTKWWLWSIYVMLLYAICVLRTPDCCLGLCFSKGPRIIHWAKVLTHLLHLLPATLRWVPYNPNVASGWWMLYKLSAKLIASFFASSCAMSCCPYPWRHTHDNVYQATSYQVGAVCFPPTPTPGIMLHFDDTLLSDLYFVNPQWLCSLMANVITIQERNPFQKNGMWEGPLSI